MMLTIKLMHLPLLQLYIAYRVEWKTVVLSILLCREIHFSICWSSPICHLCNFGKGTWPDHRYMIVSHCTWSGKSWNKCVTLWSESSPKQNLEILNFVSVWKSEMLEHYLFQITEREKKVILKCCLGELAKFVLKIHHKFVFLATFLN